MTRNSSQILLGRLGIGLGLDALMIKKDTFWNLVRQNVGQVMVKISNHVRFFIKKTVGQVMVFLILYIRIQFFCMCEKTVRTSVRLSDHQAHT